MDERFTVEVISQSLNPQQIIYAAMHQDYAEELVWDQRDQWPDEQNSGELVVKNLLQGNRGHYGPFEHPQIVLNFGYFPHSTMQQMRTHRNVSFDVQSFRYTGQRILEVAEGKQDLEDVFYLRPVGSYSDRQGKKYDYTAEQRQQDLDWCQQACQRYAERVGQGLAEEHARGLIPFDVRQHWVMSANARSLMHLLDIRGKFDVQIETRIMTELMFTQFQQWMPEVASWYEKTRWRKGPLAP
ncbi:MAG: FAD-dependent thymidylate synthase [Acaryochloridaceae cyanobacterium SU_2_1]|nr:FAD-dependent thymidylate synthase [Acaryochloridaceae cyanobacterium SU_2_1]